MRKITKKIVDHIAQAPWGLPTLIQKSTVPSQVAEEGEVLPSGITLALMMFNTVLLGFLLYLLPQVSHKMVQGVIGMIIGMGLLTLVWVSMFLFPDLNQKLLFQWEAIKRELPVWAEKVRHILQSVDLSSFRNRWFVRSSQYESNSIAQIFEGAPVGIAILDNTGRIGVCNRVFRDMVGGGAKDCRGVFFPEMLCPKGSQEVLEQIQMMLEGGGVITPLEVALRGEEENIYTVYISKTYLGGSQTLGLILYFFDTSEQKKLENQFAQSQKMQAVGQLAGGIAHDFNNLLTAMIGFCDLLLMRHSPNDQSFTDIMQIKQNANRAANLVRQLLAFSRQQTLQPKVLDITETLGETASLLRRLMGATVELKMIHGHNLGLIKVDQGQFEQVIINLAVNARDAMASGGILTIKTSNQAYKRVFKHGQETVPAGHYVLIEVVDTGCGIPPEIISRIFDPFFSTKPLGSGTGLGLSTVYGIIKQTGGFIWVDSQMGVGTKFSIYIPRYAVTEMAEDLEIAPKETVLEAVNDLTGVGTILLVEDEDAVRIFGARALRNKGYKVIEAPGGDEALACLHENKEKGLSPIDLVITDVVMSGMDGPALVKEVMKLYPSMKVIFISGYTEDAFRESLKDDSIPMHFLAKPFALKDLASKVKEVLGPCDLARSA